MANFPYGSTTYDREYVVASRTADSVTLRVKNDTDLFNAYWRQFLSGRLVAVDPSAIITLEIRGIPDTVIRVPANSPYTLQYPEVFIKCKGESVDVSSLVTVNHPSSETPGFYKLRYMLTLPPLAVPGGYPDTPIWESYLSIEEEPVLRQVITPWNRDSYTIATLTRLFTEPSFQEALYTAGKPLYNFMQANAPSAMTPEEIGDNTRRLFVAAVHGTDTVDFFITGSKLPLSAKVELKSGGSVTYPLQRIVLNEEYRAVRISIADDSIPSASASRIYKAGSVVRYGGMNYYALEDTESAPGSDNTWIEGYTYRAPYNPSYQVALGEIPSTASPAIWAPVDTCGYLFLVDLMQRVKIGHYWGYYDRKYYYDYGPNDLVSYCADGVFHLYQRTAADILRPGLENSYKPGNFRNPHWTEVYAAADGHVLPGGTAIKPYTNASNAYIAKTGSVSEEACRIYARLCNIPDTIVNAIGSKTSALLFHLLVTTRNTYEGLRLGLHALGMDIEGLEMVYPTYWYKDNRAVYTDVYKAAKTLKDIARSVKASKIWDKDGNPPDAEDPLWIRYEKNEDGEEDIIQQWNGSQWVTIYEFTRVNPETHTPVNGLDGNNRYYQAEISYMQAIAEDCLIDLGDNHSWIKQEALSSIVTPLADVLRYEIPIYIYFHARVYAYAEGYAVRYGGPSQCQMLQAVAGTPRLTLHPTRVLDTSTCKLLEIWPDVYDVDADAIVDTYTVARNVYDNRACRVYDFNTTKHLRFVFKAEDPVDTDGAVYWIERYGNGGYICNPDSDMGDVTAPSSIEDPICLVNGDIGITVEASPHRYAAHARAYLYNYILHANLDDPAPLDWKFGDGKEFASLGDIGCTVYGLQRGTIADLKTAMAYVVDRGHVLEYIWDGNTLKIVGHIPSSLTLLSRNGGALAIVSLDLPYNTGCASDMQNIDALEITFE